MNTSYYYELSPKLSFQVQNKCLAIENGWNLQRVYNSTEFDAYLAIIDFFKNPKTISQAMMKFNSNIERHILNQFKSNEFIVQTHAPFDQSFLNKFLPTYSYQYDSQRLSA